jgi:TIR domain
MSYRSDVFISYRREKYAWTPWARDIFRLALESCLQRELGDPPNIFIDDQTPIGTNFVNHLASALARSKVMVALLSKDYFTSEWCIHELDLMMEKAQGYDQIIPIVIHDGNTIPDAVALLQYTDFRDYAIPALRDAGPLHAEFWAKLVGLAPRIGNAVETAPDFDPSWDLAFRQRLTNVYNALKIGARVPPTQFTLKRVEPIRIPPRISV